MTERAACPLGEQLSPVLPGTVLLTGGTGFIGSRVLLRLVQKGYDVILLHRKTTNKQNLARLLSLCKGKAEPFVGDVTDLESLEKCLKQHPEVTSIVHLACVSSWELIEDEARVMEAAVGGTRQLLQAVEKLGKRLRFVYVSSLAATGGYDTPDEYEEDMRRKACFHAALNDQSSHYSGETYSSHVIPSSHREPPGNFKYARAKFLAEQTLLEFARRTGLIDLVIIRPGEVYGADDNAMITAKNVQDYAFNPLPVTFCISGGVSIAHRDSVAEAIANAVRLGQSGEIYELGGENLTIAEYAKLVQQICGVRKPIICVPGSIAYTLSKISTWIGLDLFNPEAVKYGRKFWYTDSQRAIRDLHYTPPPAEVVFREVIAWLKEKRDVAEYEHPHVKETIEVSASDRQQPLPREGEEEKAGNQDEPSGMASLTTKK